jgi:hypothetical protein
MTQKIRFFSSFCDTENCKNVYERLCETHLNPLYGTNFVFTVGDDYTHAIIINTAMPKLHIAKSNVIGLAFEPPLFLRLTQEFVNYAEKSIGKYFIGEIHDSFKNAVTVFREKYAFMWHITPLTYVPTKTRLISVMVSNRNDAVGHKYRHKLVQAILRTGLPVDIYGRGCQFYDRTNDSRIKGEFTELEPYESYAFHICIENFQTNHYFSEKITNALLCGTVPVYLGCRSIEEYFNNSVVLMSGVIEKDMVLLEELCVNPEKFRKAIDVREVKKRISLTENLGDLFA